MAPVLDPRNFTDLVDVVRYMQRERRKARGRAASRRRLGLPPKGSAGSGTLHSGTDPQEELS